MAQPAIPSPAAAENTASPRREPTQKRSRERVERMLTAAKTLIAEHGSDALRMSDVADRAGVSIGSLYQFFPDKGEIIRTLAERYNAEGRACIEAELANVRDLAGFREAFGRLIDIYYALFIAEPVIRDIWSGTQADKGLREIELTDSRANGDIVTRALIPLRPGKDPGALTASCFLIMYLGEAAMRLAISLDRTEGDAVVAAYKKMVLRELLAD